MKKIGIIVTSAILVMLTISCKTNLNEINITETQKTSSSKISLKINELKESGLLDELILSTNRNIISEEDDYILRFINDTDEVLEEIKKSENGDDEIAVIEAIFTESKVEDFASAFSKINSEKSDDFLSYVSENLQIDSTNENYRSINATNSLNLLFNTPTKSNTQRTAHASDLEWSIIYWYTGFCATTIAGFYLASYGGFWTKIAGWVAAIAGTASMSKQLYDWYKCSELDSFVSALAGKNSAGATKILNKSEGIKLGTIVTETTATVLVCYITPAGYGLVKFVVRHFNMIIEKILSVLPSGINYTLNRIPIKIISL